MPPWPFGRREVKARGDIAGIVNLGDAGRDLILNCHVGAEPPPDPEAEAHACELGSSAAEVGEETVDVVGPICESGDYLAENRAHWEELAELHPDTDFYDVQGFRAGGSTLDPVVVEGVGDVTGQRLLHLQCHFGLDTLSWLRAGAAAVVGVDFSATAVETARDLASEVGLADRATFVESDVYALPETLDRADGFDVVFASHGALCWLPDLTEWAAVAAHFCRPGGRLFVADSHPLSHVIQDLRLDDDGARVELPADRADRTAAPLRRARSARRSERRVPASPRAPACRAPRRSRTGTGRCRPRRAGAERRARPRGRTRARPRPRRPR